MTIATANGGRQRTSTDSLSQATRTAALAVPAGTWVRDEEAAGSNPATPTTKRQVIRYPVICGARSASPDVRFWEPNGSERGCWRAEYRPAAGRLGAGTLLPGHFRDREVGHRDHPVPGPGGVSVTIEDLARYAQACLHPPRTPLGAAITAAQAPQARIGPSREQALAWVVIDGNRRGHGGGTTGFTSCLLIDPGQGRAVALMASSHGRNLAPAALLALSGGDPHEARARSARPAIERFTRRAREAVRDSRAQARERGHYEAGAEHLLLALCEQPRALAAQVLRTAGLTRFAVEQLAVAGAGQPAAGAGEHSTPVAGEVGFTPGAVEVLRQAGTEADNLGHRGIGTEHLLLALFQDAESPAASTLAAFGMTHEDTTAKIQRARAAASARASRRETSQ